MFENLVRKKQPPPKSIWITIFASFETLFILIAWVFISQLTYNLIIRPISATHPSKFIFEMNFAGFVLGAAFLLPFCLLILWRGFVHKMPPQSIFSATNSFRIKNLIGGLIFSALFIGIISFSFEANLPNQIATRFAKFGIIQSVALLIFYLIGFTIQASFEEALFRASFVQNLCAIGLNFILAIGLSAFLFALLHMNEKMPAEVFFSTFIMALGFSYASYRTQGIEFAMGAHIANNFLIGGIFGQLDNATSAQNSLIGSIFYVVIFIIMIEGFLKFGTQKQALTNT
jgi:membrane protease YdiL (CAAX protease family)